MTWVYTPKGYENCLSSQEQEGAFLVPPTSSGGRPSATLNTTSTVNESSRHECGTDYCTTPRSGTTLGSFREPHGDGVLTSFPRGSHNYVSHFLSLESKKRKTTSGTGGPIPFGSYVRSDPDSPSSKTFLVFSPNDTTTFFKKSSRGWLKHGTMQSGVCWVLTMSEPPTKGSGYGSWPTMTANEAKCGHGYQSSGGKDFPTLTGAAGAAPGRGGVPWATPTKACASGGQTSRGGSRKGELLLAGQVQVARPWPTPTSATDRPCEGNVRMLRERVRAGLMSEEEAASMLNGKSVWEAQGNLPAEPRGGTPTPQTYPTPRNTPSSFYAESRETLDARGKDGRDTLPTVVEKVQSYPTPRANDWKGADPAREENRSGKRHAGDDLPTRVAKETFPTPSSPVWPTPKARDYKSGKGASAAARPSPDLNAVVEQELPYPSCQRPQRAQYAPTLGEGNDGRTERGGGKGQLSPDWVCWLQGWPIGWESLDPMEPVKFLAWAAGFGIEFSASQPSETVKSPVPLPQPSSSSTSECSTTYEVDPMVVREDAVEFVRSFPDETIDLVITDPAYQSIEKHRKIGTTTRLKKNWFKSFPNSRFPEFFQEVYRVLKKGSHFYVFCDWETGFVLDPLLRETGFTVWTPLVYSKVKLGMGYHYRSAYEHILFAEKGKRKLNNLGISNVLTFPRPYGGYPTEKPVELLEVLVKQSSEPGEIVIDPFTGSGSTGAAAIKQGRQFMGSDISEEAVGIATARLLNTQCELPPEDKFLPGMGPKEK